MAFDGKPMLPKPMSLAIIRFVIWAVITSAFHWFIEIALPWALFIALCWHLVGALSVNAALTWEQHKHVKTECIKLHNHNPELFEWDGLRCVYPGN